MLRIVFPLYLCKMLLEKLRDSLFLLLFAFRCIRRVMRLMILWWMPGLSKFWNCRKRKLLIRIKLWKLQCICILRLKMLGLPNFFFSWIWMLIVLINFLYFILFFMRFKFKFNFYRRKINFEWNFLIIFTSSIAPAIESNFSTNFLALGVPSFWCSKSFKSFKRYSFNSGFPSDVTLIETTWNFSYYLFSLIFTLNS